MDPRSDVELEEINSAFCLRARRVEAHSLMANEDALALVAGSGFIMRRENGEAAIERRLPDEERLESLAARVRPVILNGDPVHYGRVFNAILAYLGRMSDSVDSLNSHIDWLRSLRAAFRTVDPTRSTASYYLSLSREGEQAQQATDADLALSWFYGDLVHADQARLATGESFGINQRFAAAAVRTAQLALLTRDLWTYLKFLVERGVLPQSATESADADVTVTEDRTELTGLHLGEEGAIVKPGADPADAGFRDIRNVQDEPDGTWRVHVPWGEDA